MSLFLGDTPPGRSCFHRSGCRGEHPLGPPFATIQYSDPGFRPATAARCLGFPGPAHTPGLHHSFIIPDTAPATTPDQPPNR